MLVETKCYIQLLCISSNISLLHWCSKLIYRFIASPLHLQAFLLVLFVVYDRAHWLIDFLLASLYDFQGPPLLLRFVGGHAVARRGILLIYAQRYILLVVFSEWLLIIVFQFLYLLFTCIGFVVNSIVLFPC